MRYNSGYYVRKSELFRQHFRHVQILKTEMVRTLTFWVLKSAELDFYETESALFTLAMETVRLSMTYINQTLYKVSRRNYTDLEERQIEYLKEYV